MQLFFLFLANFCRNCAHYSEIPHDTRLQRSVCLKFNGRITEICRDDETKCGKEGKGYTEKESIPDPDIISCSSCKYYEPSFGHCKAFQTKNTLTGLVQSEYADLCRHHDSKCGKYGKYFTPYKI